jgi:hypothetical protein
MAIAKGLVKVRKKQRLLIFSCMKSLLAFAHVLEACNINYGLPTVKHIQAHHVHTAIYKKAETEER